MMPTQELLWLDEQMLLAMHSDQLAQHGGLSGVQDENLLSASLARPRHLYAYDEPTVFDLAAAYGYGLAKNHAFVDGNKRTAFVAMAVFLELNGYSLEAPEPEVVVMMERLASSQEDQQSIAAWLQQRSISN